MSKIILPNGQTMTNPDQLFNAITPPKTKKLCSVESVISELHAFVNDWETIQNTTVDLDLVMFDICDALERAGIPDAITRIMGPENANRVIINLYGEPTPSTRFLPTQAGINTVTDQRQHS